METEKLNERKSLMNAKLGDPMKKREEWTVSLRKNKSKELIESKRKRAY